MSRTLVQSSHLRSIGYDAGGAVLEIEFRDGHVYRYDGVAAVTHAALMRAISKGRYFDRFIKDRYAERRIV